MGSYQLTGSGLGADERGGWMRFLPSAVQHVPRVHVHRHHAHERAVWLVQLRPGARLVAGMDVLRFEPLTVACSCGAAW